MPPQPASTHVDRPGYGTRQPSFRPLLAAPSQVGRWQARVSVLTLRMVS